MKEVFVPALGMAMEECLLVEWLKDPGDEVVEGEDIAVIETDKATMELESPATGRLGPHLFDAGGTVPVGTTIAKVLESGDEQPTADAAPSAPATPDAEIASPPSPTGADGSTGSRQPHRLSPRQRLAAQRQAAGADEESPDAVARHREAISRSVSESWRTIPHFAVTRQVDASVLRSALDRARAASVPASMTDLLLRALALAFAANGRGGAIDLGLAVATDRGVMIPVIRDVATLTLGDLAAARGAAVARAQAGRLSPDDGAPPTSTVSNLGAYGVEQFTGVIPLGQTSMLTVGAAVSRPVVQEDRVVVGTTMQVSLNVDHRVFDGAHAAQVLRSFVAAVTDPEALGSDQPVSGGRDR